MVLTYLIRWSAACRERFARAFPEENENDISMWDLVWNATAYSTVGGWCSATFGCVVMGSRIKKRGYKTLFDRVTSRGPTLDCECVQA